MTKSIYLKSVFAAKARKLFATQLPAQEEVGMR
jgi:hypothetical protein